MTQRNVQGKWLVLLSVLAAAVSATFVGRMVADPPGKSNSVLLTAPAGTLPATMHTSIDGYDAAVLPTGRIITPVGTEVEVGAPKPYGLALSPDGRMLATTNKRTGPFSVTLISSINSGTPQTKLVSLHSTFQGVVFSKDGSRFYASAGEDGLVWVGASATGNILAVVNLNSSAHALTGPIVPQNTPPGRFKGTFPGATTLGPDGRFLYVVDQGGFQTHVIDTTKID